ncbi:MAG: TetR/AcrR family transcriptional regulator [Pseudomonadota bacterium]
MDDTDQEAAKRRPYHHGDLRAHLLRVVRELVETNGPDGFSLAEAARRAGVSTAAPYKHFSDRNDLLNGLVADAMDRLRARMVVERDKHPAASLEAISGVGKAYVEFAREEPGIFRLMFGLTEGQASDPLLPKKGEATFGVVLNAVAASTARTADNPDVSRCAHILWAFVHGLAFLSIDRKLKVPQSPEEDWAMLMDMAKGIVGPLVPKA